MCLHEARELKTAQARQQVYAAQPGITPPPVAIPAYAPPQQNVQQQLDTIAIYLKVSGAIWLIIGGLQLLASMFGYFWLCFFAGWNIYMGIMRLTVNSRELEARHPGVPRAWEKTLTTLIILLVINFLFGALIGIAGSICDLIIRSRIIALRDCFEQQPQAVRSQ